MQDMINKANGLGYEYLGFSEHNPSVSRHTKIKHIQFWQDEMKLLNNLKRVIKIYEYLIY